MLKHSQEWIAYTLNLDFAERFKVKDNRPIHFIKDKRIREYYQRVWSFKKFYNKYQWYYLLPPSQWFVKTKHKLEIKNSEWLYDRQKEAITDVLDLYNRWQKSCFVVSGTGTGKWHMLPCMVNSMKPLRVIVLAPSDVVGVRLMDDLHMAKYVRGKKILKENHDVVVTLYKTFVNYIDDLKNRYDVVIIDEWHHTAGQLEESLYRWKGFICWMSATPYRNDFDNEGFKMFFWNIIDTEKKALPIKVFRHQFVYDYSDQEVIDALWGLPTTSPEVYRRLIINNKKRYEELVLMIENIEEKWFKNFIVFSDRLEHIARIYEELSTSFPNKHIVVIKWESDVLGIMNELKWKHDFIIIGSNSVVKEGMNVPQLEVWILFVSAVFKWGLDQMAWRVNRVYGDKEFWYFVDFQDEITIMGTKPKKLWVYSRHKAYKEFGRTVWNLVIDFLNQ